MDWWLWQQPTVPDHVLLRDLLSGVDWVEVLANATAAAAVAAAHGHRQNEEHLYEVPNHFIVLLTIAYGLVSLTAVLGNSIVLYLVVQSSKLRTVTNLYIANLAIADILIGALAIPFQFQAALLQRWVLPHFLCPLSSLAQIVSVNVSVLTLSAIAIDRYNFIIHPLQYSKIVQVKLSKYIIFFIWLFAVCFAVPALIALKVKLIPDLIALRSQAVQTQLFQLIKNGPQTTNMVSTGHSMQSDSSSENIFTDYQQVLLQPNTKNLEYFITQQFNIRQSSINIDQHENATSLELIDSGNSLYTSSIDLSSTAYPGVSIQEWADLLANLSLPLRPHCDNFGMSQQHWRIYNLFLVFVQYFCPLFVISYAYLKMGLKLRARKSASSRAKRTSTRNQQRLSASSSAAIGQSSSTSGHIHKCTLQGPNEFEVNAEKSKKNQMCEGNEGENCTCSTGTNQHDQVFACSNCGHSLNQQLLRPNSCSKINCDNCGVELLCSRNRLLSSQNQNHCAVMLPAVLRHYFPVQSFIYVNKKRVVKMLIAVVLLFALCWLPLQTYNLIKDQYPEINGYRYINVIWFCSHWIAMASSTVNPFVYAIYTVRSSPKVIACHPRRPAMQGDVLQL